MFERCTESARRTLFFARGAAIERGSAVIEPEDVLSAVMRELPTNRNQLASIGESATSVSVTVTTLKWEASQQEGDIPFSATTKRVLAYAMNEADDLHHAHIGPEHLLLGILRSVDTLAEQLKREGITLQEIRTLAAAANRQS